MTTVTIDLDLLEKIGKLDAERRRRLSEYVEHLVAEQSKLVLAQWLQTAEAAHQELLTKYGPNYRVGVQDMLDEIREEPTDERLGRR